MESMSQLFLVLSALEIVGLLAQRCVSKASSYFIHILKCHDFFFLSLSLFLHIYTIQYYTYYLQISYIYICMNISIEHVKKACSQSPPVLSRSFRDSPHRFPGGVVGTSAFCFDLVATTLRRGGSARKNLVGV